MGARQRACSSPDCQRQRRRDTQADWRRRNPDYFIGRRLLNQVRRDAAWSRLPEPLGRLPWDLAKDQFTPKGADFLAELARLLVRVRQDPMPTYSANTS